MENIEIIRYGYNAGDLVSRYLSSIGSNPGEGRTKKNAKATLQI